MSYGVRTLSLLSLMLASAALLDQAAEAREFPVGASNTDKKQPEWLLDPDGSLLIPGIGRVMVPPKFRPLFPYMPHFGGGGGGMMMPPMGGGGMMSPPLGGSGGTSPPLGGSGGSSPPLGGGGSHIPGGDDTFVPNPGFEVPTPSGGGIAAPSRP